MSTCLSGLCLLPLPKITTSQISPSSFGVIPIRSQRARTVLCIGPHTGAKGSGMHRISACKCLRIDCECLRVLASACECLPVLASACAYI